MNRLDALTPPADDPRAGPLAFLEQRYAADPRHLNVGRRERSLSVAGGAALVGLGLLRGRLSGLALAAVGAMFIKRGLQGHCRLYESLGLNTAGEDHPDPSELYDHGVKIYETVRVSRPAQELYDFWHDLANLRQFMPNVHSVRDEGGGRSFWRLAGPGGVVFEHSAEIINDEPGRLIAWRTVGGADIQHAGSVRFVDAAAGATQVQLNVEYLPPAGYAGQFGSRLLRMFGRSPRDDVRDGLRRFKQLMESAAQAPEHHSAG